MSYKIAIFWQSVRPDRKNRILKMVLKNYVVFWKTVPPLDIKNSTENKWDFFFGFLLWLKNSCIITEKSLLTSSNGDWKCFFYILWKKSQLKSTFLPYHVKKHHSTLEMDTFKIMLLLSYLASLDNKPRTWF